MEYVLSCVGFEHYNSPIAISWVARRALMEKRASESVAVAARQVCIAPMCLHMFVEPVYVSLAGCLPVVCFECSRYVRDGESTHNGSQEAFTIYSPAHFVDEFLHLGILAQGFATALATRPRAEEAELHSSRVGSDSNFSRDSCVRFAARMF